MGRPSKNNGLPTSLTSLDNLLPDQKSSMITGLTKDAPTIEIPKSFRKEGKKAEAAGPKTLYFELVGNFPIDPDTRRRVFPKVCLNNTAYIYDEETKKVRYARYLKGMSTLWKEEQEDISPKEAAGMRPILEFNEGELVVSASDDLLVQFLKGRHDFEGCEHPSELRPARYRLVDTEGAEANKHDQALLKKQAVALAWETGMEDLLVHAKYLGISLTNHKGLQKSDKALIADYVEKAESNPKLFIDSYANPLVKTYSIVQDAVLQNKIAFVDGQVFWSETSTVICGIPSGENGPAFLAKMLLLPEGKELLDRLNTNINVLS